MNTCTGELLPPKPGETCQPEPKSTGKLLALSISAHRLRFPLCFLYTCWAELQGLIYHPLCSFARQEGIKGSFSTMRLSLMTQKPIFPLGSPGHREKWHWCFIRWHQHSSLWELALPSFSLSQIPARLTRGWC